MVFNDIEMKPNLMGEVVYCFIYCGFTDNAQVLGRSQLPCVQFSKSFGF